MPTFDLLVIGEINVDLILGPNAVPVYGQAEQLVEEADLTVGASGAIFAMGAAQLGLRVAYCGVVGDDVFGRYMLQELHGRGIDTQGVIVDAARKTGLSVILNRDIDRAILTHLGAIDALRAEQIPAALLQQTRHVHITSYFLQTNLQPGLSALLERIRRDGKTVSLDTNWDPNETWDSGLSDVLAETDIFLPNEQETLAIARTNDLHTALAKLGAAIPQIAVKQGADGACAYLDNHLYREPGFAAQLAGQVMDATGAGDTFNAGFLYGHLHGWEPAETLALACACGALSTRAAGGVTAQPTLQEAQSLIQQRSRH